MDMEKKVTNRLLKKLRGFQKADKGRFLLLAFGELTHEELMLYEFCVAIADWDRDHVETFGTFEATNQEIAQVLRWKADSTVSRYRKSLIDKGYFEPVGKRFRIKDFEKWELRKTSSAKMQTSRAEMQESNANMQNQSANMQGFQDQKPDYSLVSCKGNVGFSDSSNGLTEEDMKWIDENVKEDADRGTPH